MCKEFCIYRTKSRNKFEGCKGYGLQSSSVLSLMLSWPLRYLWASDLFLKMLENIILSLYFKIQKIKGKIFFKYFFHRWYLYKYCSLLHIIVDHYRYVKFMWNEYSCFRIILQNWISFMFVMFLKMWCLLHIVSNSWT